MSGSPALKPPEQRRNRTPPHRGEWVDLPETFDRVLPPYRRTFTIPKWMWDLWSKDPVTTQWTAGDLAQALELAESYYAFRDNERRLIKTALGLNAKGRRDLRWRTQLEAREQKEAAEKAVVVRRLRLIEERKTDKETA